MKKLYIQSIVACLLYSGSITPADRSITCNELWQALHGEPLLKEQTDAFAKQVERISPEPRNPAVQMLQALHGYQEKEFCASVAWRKIKRIRATTSYGTIVALLNHESLQTDDYTGIQKLLRMTLEIPEVAFARQKKEAARKAAHANKSSSPTPDHSTVTFCSSSEEDGAAYFRGSDSDSSNSEFKDTVVHQDPA